MSIILKIQFCLRLCPKPKTSLGDIVDKSVTCVNGIIRLWKYYFNNDKLGAQLVSFAYVPLTAIIKPNSPDLRAPSRYPQLGEGSPGTLERFFVLKNSEMMGELQSF